MRNTFHRRNFLRTSAAIAARGAVAVTWLPPAMGIDPASKRCDALYDAVLRLDLPLLSHGGE